MTLPRTAAEVLSDHALFEIRCVDRMLLSFRQPRLQYGSGIHGFFCHHRGDRFVSSTLMHPMTEHFAADIHHWLAARDLDLVHFTKKQRKDDIAKQYLAGHNGGERILFVGRAQEKTRIWRTRQRRDAGTGKSYPWLAKEPALVNHWYFYGFDRDFGPFYVKFCGYFPFNGQVYLNGHEYAKRQCERAGIGFTAADNAIVAAEEPQAIQRICDGLSQEAIYRFLGKWLARLPHPFTAEDEAADYRWQASIQQIELSTTQVMDRPRSARIFFDQLIRDNIDIGRPDKVSIVFDRQIRRHHGKGATPGSFRTQIITEGVDPYLYLYYKKTQVKQYLKEGRALRTETTINQTRDFGIGKELTNLPALQQVGFTANRRLLDVECISHDPADGAAALAAIIDPVITDTGTRIPGLRFTDPRVRALLNVCCTLALLPAGFTNRLLRHHLAPLLGLAPEAMTSGQISYDLRRLRAHGIITRIPHSRTYQVTPTGIAHALFITHLAQRFLIPGLTQITDPDPPADSRLRSASRAYQAAIGALARDAHLAA
ncbi:hypothetical protein OHA25_40655 [Nonomuraea sp. NBC_00507]|uniref:hypothetical protein n=1 Tax=Nonomuraea sp. NBC_00507 TaxID=2976002 RepID=UPI002E193CC7